jgi:hypothetical protein
VCCNINTNIAESWMMNQSIMFDQEIMEVMHSRRWLDIKACLKQNEFWTEKKKTDEGYDPRQKYRLVWDVMTNNINQLIDKGGLDLTMDKTTWPNSSYADIQGCLQGKKLTRVDSMCCCLTPKGDTYMHILLITNSDIQGHLQGKKTDKGGQHVLFLDSKRQYIYAWTPHHKYFEVATSPAEVKQLVGMTTSLVIGATKDPTDKRKHIFSECMHIAMVNFFSGGEVLSYLWEGGWKGTMTCRRDCLPKSVPRKYFNFIKAVPVSARSKVA